MRLVFVLMMLALWSGGAHAHRPSDAFLTLKVEGRKLSGQWEIALRDLAALSKLDANNDQLLQWGELQAAQASLIAILQQSLSIERGKADCPWQVTDLMLNDRSDGRYAWFSIEAQCANADKDLEIAYGLLFGRDPTHRCLLALNGKEVSHTSVLSPERPNQTFDLNKPSSLRALLSYMWEGMRHIWGGLDHVLFLLVLLLPAVLSYRQGHWVPQPALQPVLWRVFAVVTAFTLAHSVALSLAALNIVRLPGALVESLIAVSVMVAALNNVRPRYPKSNWGIAFVFGLIHGFGFATVLGELDLPNDTGLTALLGFNIGVEIGQLVIVLVAIPLAFQIRKTRFYRQGILRVGSLLVALIAAWWLAQRSGLVSG